MKKRNLPRNLLLAMVMGLAGTAALGQATLKVNTPPGNSDAIAIISSSSPNDPDPTEGLIVPRINAFPGNAAGFNSKPGTNSKGMLVYLQQTFTGDANAAGYTNGQVYGPGYYYWSGTQWVKFVSTSGATASGGDSSIYNSNGTLTGNRTVSTGTNYLNFSGSNAAGGAYHYLGNTAGTNSSYVALNLNNATSPADTKALLMFQNSPLRSTDGGTNAATLRNNAGSLRLQSASGSGLSIDSATGNVGVGITALAGQKLDVAGNINATGKIMLPYSDGIKIDLLNNDSSNRITNEAGFVLANYAGNRALATTGSYRWNTVDANKTDQKRMQLDNNGVLYTYGTGAGFFSEDRTNPGRLAGIYNYGGYTRIWNSQYGVDRVLIDSLGHVGLNTAPSGELQFPNSIVNKKLVLYDVSNNAGNDTAFFGLGINNGTLRYQVPTNTAHRFYVNNNNVMTIANEGIYASGNVALYNLTSSSNGTPLLIDANGNVLKSPTAGNGIGATSSYLITLAPGVSGTVVSLPSGGYEVSVSRANGCTESTFSKFFVSNTGYPALSPIYGYFVGAYGSVKETYNQVNTYDVSTSAPEPVGCQDGTNNNPIEVSIAGAYNGGGLNLKNIGSVTRTYSVTVIKQF